MTQNCSYEKITHRCCCLQAGLLQAWWADGRAHPLAKMVDSHTSTCRPHRRQLLHFDIATWQSCHGMAVAHQLRVGLSHSRNQLLSTEDNSFELPNIWYSEIMYWFRRLAWLIDWLHITDMKTLAKFSVNTGYNK